MGELGIRGHTPANPKEPMLPPQGPESSRAFLIKLTQRFKHVTSWIVHKLSLLFCIWCHNPPARHIYKADVTCTISHITFKYAMYGHFVYFIFLHCNTSCCLCLLANNKKTSLMAIPSKVIVPYETKRAHHSLFLGL